MRFAAVEFVILAVGSVLAADPNTLNAAERASGFRSLFNGRDLKGWQAPGKNWAVEDGALTLTHHADHITYIADPLYREFELRFEWKIAPGGNSGVYYRPGQMEYQVLDNAGHSDGKNPLSQAASLYAFAAPESDATQPVGAWNTARIICHGTVIEHWLNEQRVLYIDYTDPKWSESLERLAKLGGDPRVKQGRLLLQDHGDRVWYRNIRIRELKD